MEIILWFPFNIPLSELKKYLQKPTVSFPIIIVLLFFVVVGPHWPQISCVYVRPSQRLK